MLATPSDPTDPHPIHQRLFQQLSLMDSQQAVAGLRVTQGFC